MNWILLVCGLFALQATVDAADPKPVEHLLCTADYCKKELEKKKCPPLDDYCVAQNATHSGTIFPSATPCGCCEVCLKHMGEGEFCTVGAPGSRLPDSICGPGLFCTAGEGEEDATCQKMLASSKCFTAQDKYDKDLEAGTIGWLMQRPECDGDGNYKPYRCIPGEICYCVDDQGERIFGEATFSHDVDEVLHCSCSRLAARLHSVIDHRFPIAHLRCDSVGAFDVIQCMDGRCLCVDAITGESKSAFRNFTQGLEGLPCFNPKKHHDEYYLHSCEYENAHEHIIFEHREEGFNVVDFNERLCQPDGHFKRVQEFGNRRFCAGEDNEQIEHYSVDRHSPAALTMTCNCARSRKLLLGSKTALEIPECCPNGNYKKFACRRGKCYCLDDDGHQLGLEVDSRSIDQLPCYNAGADCDTIVENM